MLSIPKAQLDEPELHEDDASELTNDMMFLESWLQDLKEALDVPISQFFLREEECYQ